MDKDFYLGQRVKIVYSSGVVGYGRIASEKISVHDAYAQHKTFQGYVVEFNVEWQFNGFTCGAPFVFMREQDLEAAE